MKLMPYSVKWPNDDIQVIIGSISQETKDRAYKYQGYGVNDYKKYTPMLRAVLVDCINPKENSKRILGIKVGRLNYAGRAGWGDGRVWLTLVMPKSCERDNPMIERMLKWTLHSCVLWAALAAGYDDVDRAVMGEVAAHLHQFEYAGYKTAKQCRMVLHSAMITEVLPWKVSQPRRVQFKSSNWTACVENILWPETVGKYWDPFSRIDVDKILDVADARVVIKFIFTGFTTDNFCAIVIATVKELDAILISVSLDLLNEQSDRPR